MSFNNCLRILLLWFGVVTMLFGEAYLNEAVVPTHKDYDLSGIPPSATKLLKEERVDREARALKSLKRVVQEVVDAETRKTKGRKHSGILKKKGKERKAVHNKRFFPKSKVDISWRLIDILQRQYQDPELENKKVTLHLKKMPIKNVLEFISNSTGIQLIVDADVTGHVQALKLDQVPLAAVLYSVLSSNNPRLALVKNLGVWRVMRMQTAQELFAGIVAQERKKDFISIYVTLKNVKWNDDLKKRIENLWNGINRGDIEGKHSYLVCDGVNKKVFCRGRKTNIDEFKKCLQEIDIKIPQIRIDARVVIADKSFEESLGFNWSGVYNRRVSVRHSDFVGLGPITSDVGSGLPSATESHSLFKNLIGWSLNFVPEAVKSTIKIPFVFGNKDLSTKRLNLELNAAENQNKIRTILKPSLLVHNQEVAEILVGEQLPHAVRLDETIESRLTNITTVNYKDIGTKIQVKPSVASDHSSVFLEIFVENSLVTRPSMDIEQTNGQQSNVGNTQTSFNYTIKTSRSKNRVLLKSGQTTMIGGLISSSVERSRSGIPYLQDIPVVGLLFQGRQKKIVDQQLLIFITPTLVV